MIIVKEFTRINAFFKLFSFTKLNRVLKNSIIKATFSIIRINAAGTSRGNRKNVRTHKSNDEPAIQKNTRRLICEGLNTL